MARKVIPVSFFIPELNANTNTLGNGDGPRIGYTLVGRESADVFRNKTLLDPSNKVAASSVTANGTVYPIVGTPTTGDVLTFDGSSMSFQSPGSSTSGTNTLFGFEALLNNTTGVDNSAFGYRAVYNNTTGVENTGFGMESLYYNDTGPENTAFGSRALGNHPVAVTTVQAYEYNAAFGSHAMMLHEIGNRNTAIGTSAMLGAIPTNVAPNQIFHESCTAVGNNALTDTFNTTRDNALGREALAHVGTGVDNCAFGYQSIRCRAQDILNNNLSRNSAYGCNSLRFAHTVSTAVNNTAIGYNCMGRPAGAVIGNSFLGVLAGRLCSADYLCGFGYQTLERVTGADNSAFGAYSGLLVTSGVANSLFGFRAGDTLTTGSNNTIIGASADVSGATISNSIVLGSGAISQATGEFVIGSAGAPVNTVTTPVAGGAADALPANPTNYLRIRVNGVMYKIPLYT